MSKKIIGRINTNGNFDVYSTGPAQFDEANYTSKSGPSGMGTFIYSELFENEVAPVTKEIALEDDQIPARHFSDDSLTVRGEFVENGVNPTIDSINISSLNLNEGDTITFNIAGTDFIDGQQIYYEIVSSEEYQTEASQTSYNLTNLNPSANISFATTSFNVAPGTTIYYDISGTIPANGFDDGTLTGVLTSTSVGFATLTKTINSNSVNSQFNLNLRTGSNSGPIVATSSTVSVAGTYIFQNSSLFSYTGSDQTFTVPSGVEIIKVTMWGAGGSGGISSDGQSQRFSSGGAGGVIENNVISVTPGENLTIQVGEGVQHIFNSPSRYSDRSFEPSGTRYGGGGAGTDSAGSDTLGGSGGGAGGGSSAIKRGSTFLLTAGGGGGGGGWGGICFFNSKYRYPFDNIDTSLDPSGNGETIFEYVNGHPAGINTSNASTGGVARHQDSSFEYSYLQGNNGTGGGGGGGAGGTEYDVFEDLVGYPGEGGVGGVIIVGTALTVFNGFDIVHVARSAAGVGTMPQFTNNPFYPTPETNGNNVGAGRHIADGSTGHGYVVIEY